MNLFRVNYGLIAKCYQRSNAYFSVQAPFHVELLKKRTVLKLSGPDTSKYLQSMITNDIGNIESLPTLYSLLLNPKGRVLYDIILYKTAENEYLVEYDKTGVEYLQKHLLMYRLRKNVLIEPFPNMDMWVIYRPHDNPSTPNYSDYQDLICHLDKINGINQQVIDPRTSLLGVRVITERGFDLTKELKSSNPNLLEGDSYSLLRYKLGIGEGVLDHPPGNCLPFETNVDLLNGVSFSKGCYIGQEMTAKSNFVLSIRKRLMPVLLDESENYPMFPPECNILNEKQQKMGRLRCHLGQHGLALLKYEDCMKSEYLQLQNFDIKLKAIRPSWWPDNLSSDVNEKKVFTLE